MTEARIETIISSRWVPKVGKYVVTLAFNGERAKEVWMTDRQLEQLESCFERTPHWHSTDTMPVIGLWNERGYYAYAKVHRVFDTPYQYDLEDLNDTED